MAFNVLFMAVEVLVAAGPGAELSDTLTVTDRRGRQGRLITQSKRETWKDLSF